MVGRIAGAALLLTALCAVASAQSITVQGAGCGRLPPAEPANLRATPGDGSVTLSWDRPSNGACVDEYIVTVTPLGNNNRAFGQAPQRTPQFTVTIQNLENGQPYLFTVQAFSRTFNTGGSASVQATPAPPEPVVTRCFQWYPPSAPTALRATPMPGKVNLCWNPPANLGCVDEYRVEIREQDPSTRSLGSFFRKVNKGGCILVDSLRPVPYVFTVTAYSNFFNGGDSASIVATPLPKF